MKQWHVTLTFSGTVEADDPDVAISRARESLMLSPGSLMAQFEANAHIAPAQSGLPTQDRHEH